jgi:hypothetical protein
VSRATARRRAASGATLRRLLRRACLPAATLLAAGVLAALPSAPASAGCTDCADHDAWPARDGVLRIHKAPGPSRLVGTARADELLGHHGSDVLVGRSGSDVLWGDAVPGGQPSTQYDRIRGGAGNDFIYGSHGRNTIHAGAGNDVISVHFGRGLVDCGPGRDLYHVARSRRHRYRFRNCEVVDYRSEAQRGHGLRPLP